MLLEQAFVPASARLITCANRRGVTRYAALLFLGRQPGAAGVEGMIQCQERLLAVQDRGVARSGVVQAFGLVRAERELDAAHKRGMRIGLEIGINQVRNLARMPVQIDQVGAVDLAEVRPRAAFVNPQQRLERIERAFLDTQCIRQQLAERRPPARFIYSLGIAGPKEQVIGLAPGLRTTTAFRAGRLSVVAAIQTYGSRVPASGG